MDQSYLIPLIILGFPIFFGGMWCFVCWLLANIGGWQRLAARFPAKSGPPAGKGYHFQSAQLGVASYRSTLSLHCTDDGMHFVPMVLFRFAHPPLFIPWREMHNARAFRFLWLDVVKLDIGEPKLASIQLPKAVFQGTPLEKGLINHPMNLNVS
jgi:hypothetical protein